LGCQIFRTIWKNGLCDGFCFFVCDGCDQQVLCESVGDAKDVFVLMSGGEHWAKKVSMNPDIWLVRYCQWLKYQWLGC
jgi:hypothetical protein